MILQALVRYYEALSAAGKIACPGWSRAGVSYALSLDENGELVQVIYLKSDVPQGKKMVLRPQDLNVPAQGKRSVGIVSNFLCDNGTYFLGIDAKGNPQRAKECFLAARERHLSILSGLSSPRAQAVCRFFTSWQPEAAAAHPALSDVLEEIRKGGNLVFWADGGYVQDDPEVRAAWQAQYDTAEGVQAQCLVTGKTACVARLHPVIKNVRGAQAVGASLVSFNGPAFESYGHEQGDNAPVSQYAAFAYGAALNYLLADRERVQRIGDTTVVAWAEDGETASQDAFEAMLFGKTPDVFTDADLRDLTRKLALGLTVNWGAAALHPTNRFYVLGLAPNAARLSVRFFLDSSIAEIAQKVQCHDDRLEIIHSGGEAHSTLWLWNLLNETVNQNSRDKSPSPQLAGDTLRAILTDTPYPATLYNGVQLRIRAEHRITWGRAAIIKAYLIKNAAHMAAYKTYKEVLTVELNENCTYLPYLLGRLFSVLEDVQLQASPGIKATIRDKYFNAACSMPDTIFPLLINLAQKHLKKVKGISWPYYVRLSVQLEELLASVHTDFPQHLSLHDQGIFQLGYYHQTQERYQKQEG